MSTNYDNATNIVDSYYASQQLTLRWISVSSSCLSIVFGLGAFYLYANMRMRVFRHHLILLLLLFDFGKAVVLLWYPARVLMVPSAYDNINFCDVVGFSTSALIEGADLAVLALAVHTALLTFRHSKDQERGGLYKYRYWVCSLTVIVPLIMASLAFVNEGRKAYRPYITWCYLPIRPLWYRLALSWIPRYIIIISIIVIYISIYIYIKMQYREVRKDFRQSQRHVAVPSQPWFQSSWNMTLLFLSNFPGCAFVREPDQRAHHLDPVDPQTAAIVEVQRTSMAEFEIRRSMIERQIRSIFVYPAAYVFLWLAPFALQCRQYYSELPNNNVFWLSALAAFMQPFNCVVDTVAFCLREKPWKNSKPQFLSERKKRHLMCFLKKKPRTLAT
jgi:G protein-coupled receptor GPR1